MAKFHYEAVTAAGETVTGAIEADDQAAVISYLHGLGHVPIRAAVASRSSSFARLFSFQLRRPQASTRHDLALLTQQLATLLHAGLPLDRTLEIAEKVVARPAARERLRHILDRVRGGSSLADAMASQGDMFPKFYVGMVRAGETGGSLDATLKHLGEFLEKTDAAREQIRSALIYPAIVFATGCGSVAMLFGFVVPRFRPLFDQAGSDLPVTAQAVLAVSDLIQNYGWLAIAAVAAIVAIAVREWRNPLHRARWDRMLLKLPVVGDVVIKIEVARVARTFGTLLKNGLAPLSALTITREAAGNSALNEALAVVADDMKEGKGVAVPLSRSGLVPPLALQLISVGEETARLDDMLIKVAEIYEQESRRSIERLLSMLVPVLTVGLGALVAVVIGSILTAVLSVYDLAT